MWRLLALELALRGNNIPDPTTTRQIITKNRAAPNSSPKTDNQPIHLGIYAVLQKAYLAGVYAAGQFTSTVNTSAPVLSFMQLNLSSDSPSNSTVILRFEIT